MKNNQKWTSVLVLLLAALLCTAVLPVYAANEAKEEAINEAKASFSDLYEAINPSVVYIAVAVPADESENAYGQQEDFDFGDIFGPQFEEYFKQFFDEDQGYGDEQDYPEEWNDMGEEEDRNLTYGSGTGFVWDNEGHIVTNDHVVGDAVKITVTYSDGTERDATLVATDPDSDLAVIQVEDFKEGLTPVTLGDSSAVKPGDLAAAIGNPLGQTGTMTQGIISAVHRSYAVSSEEGGNYTIPDVLQTDASINPGNSGGVLINSDGEVIGVVMAFSSYSYSSAGIGYAIPSNRVARVVPALIEKGEYQHPWLGISGTALSREVNEYLEQDKDTRGAFIQTVTEGGPSDKAGIRGGTEELELESGYSVSVGGDIVTMINDREVKSMDDIIAYLSSDTSVGDVVTLHILRDGKEMDVDITLEARPTQEERSQKAQAKAEEEEKQQETGQAYLGAYISELTPDVLDLMDLPEDTEGVLVTSVTEEGPADDAGLKGCEKSKKNVQYGGDIIIAIDDTEVTGVRQLKDEIAKRLPGERITLTILRDGETKDVRLALGNTLSR